MNYFWNFEATLAVTNMGWTLHLDMILHVDMVNYFWTLEATLSVTEVGWTLHLDLILHVDMVNYLWTFEATLAVTGGGMDLASGLDFACGRDELFLEFCRRSETPSQEQTQTFMDLCERFIQLHPLEIIGRRQVVHLNCVCTQKAMRSRASDLNLPQRTVGTVGVWRSVQAQCCCLSSRLAGMLD